MHDAALKALEPVAADLSREALQEQERVLKDLRGSAASLITASCLIASFLGAQALQAGGLEVLAILALSAFFLAVASSLVVLLPNSSDAFGFLGSPFYGYFYENPDEAAEADLTLASWRDGLWQKNRQRLRKLYWYFRAACLFLVTETVLWAVHLGANL